MARRLQAECGFPVPVAIEAGDVLGHATFGAFNPRDAIAARPSMSMSTGHRSEGRRRPLVEALDLVRAMGEHVMIAGIEAAYALGIARGKLVLVQSNCWRRQPQRSSVFCFAT